ncbi:MAG TPA: RecQ family ATP-dependent DNA helicase [Chitinophagales bacterium]|nr:RecQ family ATP-dependent DNA helicase [Chitinophagales bacterium]
MSIHEILKQHWGFSQFREMQEDIINSALEGNDTLALMPTGGGKSICYQVPALAKEGICIVISPLIALMKDQVSHLQSKGIKAVAVYSGMSQREIDVALDNSVLGHYKLLYVSPERLLTEIMQVRAQRMKVNLLAVDEAHCISQWGYDFRPPYLRIAEFRKLIPNVPVLALTATATPDVVNDICEKLNFGVAPVSGGEKKIFRKSFQRKNLSYSVLFEEDKFNRVVKMIEKVKGTALVYVRNRRRTKEIAEFLQRKKISAGFYHAGLTNELRSQKQEDWMTNRKRVMVCTNAFGMGIDKPDVRLVIHWDVPDSLEEYFQEAGRAGRDEKKSFAVLLYNNSDILDLSDRMKHGIPPIEKLKATYQALGNFFQLATGAGANDSFDFDIAKFCKTYRLNPIETYEALKVLDQEGYISSTDSVYMPSRAMMIVDKEVLYRFEVEHKKYEPLIRMLLRAYSGIFEEFVTINEHEIARFLETDRESVNKQLKELQHLHLLDYEPRKDSPQIVFTRPREENDRLQFNIELLKKRRAAHEHRLSSMKKYVTSGQHCRSQMLLSYFGEKNSARCGICDVCLKRNRLDLSDLEFEEISNKVKRLLQQKPQTISDVVNKTEKVKEQKTLRTIQFLLDNRELELNKSNQLILRT